MCTVSNRLQVGRGAGWQTEVAPCWHVRPSFDNDMGVKCGKSLPRQSIKSLEVIMLKWAAIFFVIAIVAAVLGFGGIAAGASEIAKILFFVFVVIFLVTLIMGMMRK